MSDQQPPSSPGWVPPGQSQPPTAPWTPPPGQQPPPFTPSGGTQIPPPPPAYGQPSTPPGAPGGPAGPGGPWQSQPPGGPGGPWQSQPPGGPAGQKSKTPLILAGVGALAVIVIIAAVIFMGGDDDKNEEGTTGTTPSSETTTTEEEPTTTTEEEEPTTTTEAFSGELEVPEPVDGFQVYEDPAGEFAVTFPDDWTTQESQDIGGTTALLVALGPPENGFSTNLNLLTTPGADDGEFAFDDFPETQTDALANADGFENVDYELLTIGGRDAFVITYTIDQSGNRADGYQYYVPGESDIYILTVTVPEFGDRQIADDIGESLRVV